jgi:hypothetical protein
MLMQNAQPLICDARVLTSFDQGLLEAAALDMGLERAKRLHGVGRDLIGIQSRFHGGPPSAYYPVRIRGG